MHSNNWLRQKRIDLGLTQDELVTRLQLQGFQFTRSTVSNWEMGKHNLPLEDETFRAALSNALKMSVKDILRQSGYEVVSDHSDAGERAAYLVDRLPSEKQQIALKILEQFD